MNDKPEESVKAASPAEPPYRPGGPIGRNDFLLVLGVVLLLLPLAFVVGYPEHYEKMRITLRIISALGAALIGAWLPGLLNLEGTVIKAGGALAILVLFFMFDPPAATNETVNNESPDEPALEIPGQPPADSHPAPPPVQQVTPTTSTPMLACAFVPIRAIGWRSGHKTNYCKNYGYELGNFNQGDYKNGGICMTGPEPDVCKDKVTNKLASNYECATEGIRTICVRRS